MPNPSRLVYSQSMGSLGPVRVQRRAATNGVARCNAAAAMRATNSSVSVTMRLDKKSSSSRSHKLRVSQRPVAALGIGSRAVRCGPSTPGHSHLARPGFSLRNAAIRAIGGARDGSPQSSHTQRAPHGSLPSLVSAEAAPASSDPITQLLSSFRNHGARGHVQRRARW